MRMTLWPHWLWRQLKRRAPDTLFARSLAIIVLPVAIMQIGVTWAFFDAHWQTVNSRLTEGLAGDVAMAVQAYNDDPTPAGLQKLSGRFQQSADLSIVFQDGGVLPGGKRPSLFVAVDRSLQKSLAERLDAPFWFDAERFPHYVDVRVKVKGGTLRIIAPKDRVFATQGHIFILWLTVATVLLTSVSILFIRNQVRAIERLADASEAFGKGADDSSFRPHGAREVRRAAQAFIAMKLRIHRYVDQRTALLASVSHDLRTPLTRLKLELALAEPGPRNEEMKRDLAEMEHMIDEYLAFARGQGGESVETIGVRGLIEEVSEGAKRAGAQVEVQIDPELSMHVRPNAFKRAISNLVMNAAVHGERVEVAARPSWDGGVEILVDDNGPGIPPDRYEEAFKPFNRLDEARNQNAKGVGLGLAIARDVARGHGGDVTLDKSPLGGLRAVVRLPG